MLFRTWRSVEAGIIFERDLTLLNFLGCGCVVGAGFELLRAVWNVSGELDVRRPLHMQILWLVPFLRNWVVFDSVVRLCKPRFVYFKAKIFLKYFLHHILSFLKAG